MKNDLTVTLEVPIDEAEQMVRSELKEQGFGVLTEIDVARVFAEKLDVSRRPLKILGACNPVMAHDALSRDATVALALPCNVVLDSTRDDVTTISIADPSIMMPGEEFADLAGEAKSRLMAVLAALAPPRD